MSEARVELIRERLTAALSPKALSIRDDSAEHVGHAGAKSGGGHFTVFIVSDQFEGQSLIQRHRMVYDAVGDAMHTEIHALSIEARTTAEAGENAEKTSE